eukprot:663540-Pelagomonas_calceolata.AAC.1
MSALSADIAAPAASLSATRLSCSSWTCSTHAWFGGLRQVFVLQSAQHFCHSVRQKNCLNILAKPIPLGGLADCSRCTPT